jgi:FkbM family methyltransferase
MKKTLVAFVYKIFLIYLRQSASDAGQDRWIIDLVFPNKRSGFFVELGAYDGIHYSNTLVLENGYDWRGILIEPDPHLYNLLKNNRKSACVNACIGSDEDEGLTVKFESDGMLGRVVDSNNKLTQNAIDVIVKPLHKVLLENNAPSIIDYLSLDVEGYEDKVLLNFPFDRYKFLAMTIERPSMPLKDKLRENGYFLVQEIPTVDAFYIHNDLTIEYRNKMQVEHWNWILFKINAVINKFM